MTRDGTTAGVDAAVGAPYRIAAPAPRAAPRRAPLVAWLLHQLLGWHAVRLCDADECAVRATHRVCVVCGLVVWPGP